MTNTDKRAAKLAKIQAKAAKAQTKADKMQRKVSNQKSIENAFMAIAVVGIVALAITAALIGNTSEE